MAINHTENMEIERAAIKLVNTLPSDPIEIHDKTAIDARDTAILTKAIMQRGLAKEVLDKLSKQIAAAQPEIGF